MIFKKKKKKGDEEHVLDEDADIDDEDITGEKLETDEAIKEFLDEDEEINDDQDPEAISKYLVFEIENGCPVCGSDVKGNDFYRYYCENCNILFEKKDILEKEFGQSAGHVIQGVRKTRLTPEEKKDLEQRRKELKDRIYSKFSEEQKQDTAVKEEDKEESPLAETAAEIPQTHETIAEHEEQDVIEAEQENIAEEVDSEEAPETGMEDIIAALGKPGIQEAQYEDAAPEQDSCEEYELEPGRIIASSQSTKFHEGSCHFVKKIHPENRVYFEDIAAAEQDGYQPCVCIRRIVAKQKTKH